MTVPVPLSPEILREAIYKPSTFARDIMLKEPYDYNIPFLDDLGLRLIYRGGRQFGKSTCVCIKVLHWAWFMPYLKARMGAKMEGGRGRIIIVSTTLDQSKKLIEDMQEMIKRSPYYSPTVINSTRTRIDVRCQGPGNEWVQIIAVAGGTAGDSTRGYTNDVVVLDECGSSPDEVYYTATPGGIAARFVMYLTGTPSLKKSGFFFDKNMESQLITQPGNDKRFGYPTVAGGNPKSVWRQYNATSLDNPQVTDESLQEFQSWSKDTYAREILGIFVGTGGALFSREDLEACLGEPVWPETDTPQYYMGVDVAHGGDDTVYCIVGVMPGEADGEDGNLWIEHLEGRGTSTTVDVADRVYEIYHEYMDMGMDISDIYIDSTGMGQGVYDMLELYGVGVSRVVFTSALKMSMYTYLSSIVARHKIRFGSDESESRTLIDQMIGVSVEAKVTSRIKTVGADDYPDALAAAVWAARESTGWSLWLDKHGHAQGLGALFQDGNQVLQNNMGKQWKIKHNPLKKHAGLIPQGYESL